MQHSRLNALTMKGHLILLVSVPGGGKGVLLEHLRATFPDLIYAVSCTTRHIRPGEVDGVNYYFVTKEKFRSLIDEGKFLEWTEIDGGNRYGTLKSEVLEPLEEGKVVIREVEIQGADAIRNLVPKENLLIIFIDAGIWERLEKRIVARAPITQEELAHRKERYIKERAFIKEADVVVDNSGELDAAKCQIEKIVTNIVNTVQS